MTTKTVTTCDGCEKELYNRTTAVRYCLSLRFEQIERPLGVALEHSEERGDCRPFSGEMHFCDLECLRQKLNAMHEERLFS